LSIKNLFQREKFVLFSYEIKKSKKPKKPKKPTKNKKKIFGGFFRWLFLGGFFGRFFIANPASRASPSWSSRARRRCERCWTPLSGLRKLMPGLQLLPLGRILIRPVCLGKETLIFFTSLKVPVFGGQLGVAHSVVVRLSAAAATCIPFIHIVGVFSSYLSSP
jgi:hypothetical protein